MSQVEISTIDANGMRFTCRFAGAQDGAPVLLLHGFPETSAMWEGLMGELAKAGYRCAAPDQRGYSAGARPDDVSAYSYDELSGDVFAIADALGWRRFHLVTHDWGALVGWHVLKTGARRIASFTAMSIPHYRAFAESSWEDDYAEGYRKFLALVMAPDGAAERVFGRDDFAGFRETWSANPQLMEEYLRVFREPGALTAALNWYRATDAHRSLLATPKSEMDNVAVPTLLIWGRNDPYVGEDAIIRGHDFMRGPYRVVDLDAGHWLVQEAPDAVREAVLTQLQTYP